MQGKNIKLLGLWIMIKEHSFIEEQNGFILNVYGLQGDEARKVEYFKGRIIAVSEKLSSLKVGDDVIFDAYSGGYEVDWNGEEHFITKPENVWAIIDEVKTSQVATSISGGL